MKLPIPSLFDKKPKAEYFLSLLLRDEKATAVIIEEQQGKIKIIGKHEEFFTVPVEEVNDEELLRVLDKAISIAEEKLPPEIETQKTVFGVKENWVEEKKIKKEYLAKLKKVCDTLHLTPIGFLVISEAIAHLIQEEEGAPLSAILCEIGSHSVIMTIFRAGKIVETKHTPIIESPTKTVDTLLKHVESVEVLPSRIIIFDGKRTDDLAQQFISHQWSKSLPFLHMPQISVLPFGFETKSVIFGAAIQMGFEITGAIIDKTGHEIKTFASESGKPQEPDEQKAADIPLSPESVETPSITPTPDVPLDLEQTTGSSSLDQSFDIDSVPADNFGFVMDEDIATIAAEKDTSIPEKIVDEESAEQLNEQHFRINHHETTEQQDEHGEKKSFLSFLPLGAVMTTLTNLKAKLPKSMLRLPGMSSMRNTKLLVMLGGIIILVGVIGFFYFSALKATVTLHIKTQGLEEKPSLTFSLTSPNQFSDNIIAAEKVTTSLDGTSSTSVTGKKEVGTNAKGTVTIYNNGETKKTLSAGQVVTSSNNVEFTLDKELVVASASGDIFSGTKPGTAQAAVTAKAIGTEGNLPSNTKFTVSGNSSIAAKNDSAFSGGSKKDVTVVAKADMDKLRTSVQKDLEEKAKGEIQKKLGGEQVLLPDLIDVTLDKESFDKKLGEEAKTLNLKATVTFTAGAYKKSDLTEFAQIFLKNKFSQDLTVSEKGITTEVTDLKQEDDEVTGNVTIKAALLPKLDTTNLQKEITGKSFTSAEQTLKKVPQVQTVDIALSPNFPLLPKILPQKTTNILVSIATDE